MAIIKLSDIGFLVHGDGGIASYDANSETLVHGAGGVGVARGDVLVVNDDWCLVPTKTTNYDAGNEVRFLLVRYERAERRR